MAELKDYLTEIGGQITRAAHQRRPHVEINAGELERVVGSPKLSDQQIPLACDAMQSAMREGDVVVCGPQTGKGSSLTVRYVIPRK